MRGSSRQSITTNTAASTEAGDFASLDPDDEGAFVLTIQADIDRENREQQEAINEFYR